MDIRDEQQWVRTQFFSYGLQYYFSARFAAIGGLIPVAGNLYHHAIEMFLKGHLSLKLTEGQLKGVGHDLKKLWERFKQDAPCELAEFDSTVDGLHSFESIRYPQKLVAQGGSMVASMALPPGFEPNDFGSKEVPQYSIVIQRLDQFVRKLFHVCSINPMFFQGHFFIAGLRTQATEIMSFDNQPFSDFWK